MLAFACSTALHAEILDGGEIQFSGFVTDDTPKWTWQVNSPDQNWSVDIADGENKNGVLVFNLHDQEALPFLEGHLNEVAERGGQGFTPLITFSSNGQPFSVLNGRNSTAQHFRASVPVRDPSTGNIVGKLLFTLNQGLAISMAKQNSSVAFASGMSLLTGQTVNDVKPAELPGYLKSRLSSLLAMNKGFGNEMSVKENGKVLEQNILTNENIINLAASYASSLSDFELYLPKEDTPSQWQATLNVTVTVQ